MRFLVAATCLVPLAQCAWAWVLAPARDLGSGSTWISRSNFQRHAHQSTSTSLLASSTTASSSPSLEVREEVSAPPIPSSSIPSESATDVTVTVPDARECAKLFGRLADKYLLLDASAGQCCYSGCSDCEFRLPGGGYRMADQRSARPKWIPVYAKRQGAGDVVHESKWGSVLFGGGIAPRELSWEEFGQIVRSLPYEAPLGAPSVPVSEAADVSEDAVERLWYVLSRGKDRLTERGVARQLQRLAFSSSSGGGGAEASGVTWKQFLAALQQSDPTSSS